MKNLFLLIVLVVITTTSCTKQVTTIQVFNKVSPQSSYNGIDGTMYNATLLMYKDDDVVGQVELGNIRSGGGKSEIIEPEDYVQKARVMFKTNPTSSEWKFTVQYFVLIEDDDNDIIINDQTLITGSLKK